MNHNSVNNKTCKATVRDKINSNHRGITQLDIRNIFSTVRYDTMLFTIYNNIVY